MESQEIIDYIANAKKRTMGKMFLRTKMPIQFDEEIEVYGNNDGYIIFDDVKKLREIVNNNLKNVISYHIDCDRANSGVPLLNYEDINARIEPGAIIRDKVTIEENAIIMMGAVINIGAKVGSGSMIDMNSVLGANAQIGSNVHVGAGAVISGVVEPPSAKPCIINDNVTIGANAVILEGITVGEGAVVAASSVVLHDVPPKVMVAGVPAKVIKQVDERTINRTQLVNALRCIEQEGQVCK